MRARGTKQPNGVHRWFVTCEWATVRIIDGTQTRWPNEMAHAKSMGGMTTECGLTATSWVKLYELSFEHQALTRCPNCQAVVEASKLTKGRRAFRAISGDLESP